MAYFSRTKALYIFTALALWLGLAFSMGWYHHVTSLGRSGWPLPTPEAAATFLVYRESADVLGSNDQSIYWMLVVPLVGFLWVALLYVTAPFFGQHGQPFPESLRRFAVANLPLGVMGLVVAAAAWKWGWGVWWGSGLWGPWKRILNPPWPWLLWAYEGCAVVSLIMQALAYSQTFQIRVLRILGHLLMSLGLLALVGAGTGTLLGELLARLL
jgi:hypothetical protein